MRNAANLTINSDSVGDPALFRTLDCLELSLANQPDAPTGTGRVALIVRRVDGGLRVLLDRVAMTPESGLPGDAWGRQAEPLPDAQLAVMQLDVAELIANGQPLELSGDNLYLELDLSVENLPAGSRLRVGEAMMEVTPQPHNGCRKFRARFGDDALRFVSMPELRHRNLRGIYLRVIEPGEVAVGDPVQVLARPSSRIPANQGSTSEPPG
jgi:MOSC domain-containing protein YiiM